MSSLEPDDESLRARLALDERAGPARRIAREQSGAMIEQALDTWQAVVPQGKRRPAWLKSVAVAAAASLVLAAGAGAARWYYGRAPRPSAQQPQAAPSARVTARAPAPQPSEARLLDQQSSAEPLGSAPVERARVERAKSEPEDLLQQANRLRAAGRFQAAADSYARVYQRYPRSLSAYAAQVAAGSLLLDHLAKPERARKLFERALSQHPQGALDLEARQGLALALRELGRTQDEQRVLRSLTSRHAGSPAAKRAAARLAELGQAP